MLVDDPQGRVGKLDGDDHACVTEADLDVLAGDLDAAAAGYPPLDCRAELWQRAGPDEADAWPPVPLRGGTGQRRVRHRMPSWVMTSMTWPSRRIVALCPASGEPAWMTWLASGATAR
jgi:hypothetical protein